MLYEIERRMLLLQHPPFNSRELFSFLSAGMFLSFLSDRKTKTADFFPQLKVLSMRERGQMGPGQTELALFVKILRVNVDCGDISQEHIMGAERDNLCYPALQADRALRQDRSRYSKAFLNLQPAGLELIEPPPGTDAAEISGADHGGSRCV